MRAHRVVPSIVSSLSRSISMVIGIVTLTVVAKGAGIGNARWRNLAVGELLIAVLVVYLIRERYCPHSAA